MMLPLQITFRHMESSPALAARIRALASKLDRFSAHIIRCHVVVAPPAHHRHKGTSGSTSRFQTEKSPSGMPTRQITRTGIPTWRCAMHSARPAGNWRTTSVNAMGM